MLYKGENLKPEKPREGAIQKTIKQTKMKKVKFEGKLSLNKVTVAKLNDEQMKKVVGGGQTEKPSTTVSTNNTCGLLCTY